MRRRLLLSSFALGFALVLLRAPASATTEDTQPQTRSNPVIATPEAVKADFHSGGVGYTYKIDLPPAAGIVPELALSFSSLTGNTEYGRGWTLNLGKIERSTRSGPPTYGSPTTGVDPFELDGAMLVQDPDNDNRFHLEQTDHRRILYHASTAEGTDYWEVTTPDGTRYLYGSRSAANSKLDGDAVGSPLANNTFRWALDKVVDPRGNWYEIDYAYETFAHPQPSGGPIVYNMNNHPDVIRYSYHDSESAGRQRRIVDFQWDDMRGEAFYNDDRPTSYRSGFKIQISERLTDIEVGTDANGNGAIDEGERIRRYQLLYNPKPFWGDPDSETLPPYSQLAAIQRYGRTDEDVFPSRTEFNYTRPPRAYEGNMTLWTYPTNTQGVDFTRVEYYLGPAGNHNIVSDLEDMNGDGFVDFVYWDSANENLWVAYGPVVEGGSFADEETEWGFAQPVLWGTPDPPPSGLKEVFTFGTQNNSFAEGYTRTELIDIDGDGLPDWVSLEGPFPGWNVARNLGNSFGDWEAWGQVGVVEDRWRPACTEEGLPCQGDGGGIVTTLVDVNGDGRPDLVTGDVGDGDEVWVLINNGHGFEGVVPMPLNDFNIGDGINDLGWVYLPTGLQYTDSMFADANGDGLADAFGADTCLGAARQAFSLGSGWQTLARTGQGYHDDAVSVPPENRYCDSGSNALDPIRPETIDNYFGTVVALLDLNGGINNVLARLSKRQRDGAPIRSLCPQRLVRSRRWHVPDAERSVHLPPVHEHSSGS